MKFLKLIAKPPVKKVLEQIVFGAEFKEIYTACPRCGVKLNELNRSKYCSNCGQKLDWRGHK